MARPRVLVNLAVSLDGKINPGPGWRAGPFMMSRHRKDRARMRDLRQRADAILIGAANLRADDPDLALSDAEHRRRRAGGLPEPWRIVVTTSGQGLAPDMKMFDPARGGGAIVVHTAAMPAGSRAALGAVARLHEMDGARTDVGRVLAWMKDTLGVTTLLCEGGGDLCAALFAARAVDEMYLTLVPRVLGGGGAPTPVAGPGWGADDIPDATLGAIARIGDELFLRYDFDWTRP